jgi:bis(5'-nucleosidyl)-tetraphosphatase
MSDTDLPKLKTCGVLCFRRTPEPSFLLLKQPKRWDVAKGRLEQGESEHECALRELREETGILPHQVEIDPTFRFETHNPVKVYGKLFHKDYVVFLAYMLEDVSITLSEHEEYKWVAWNPPHKIQKWLIDPLLAMLEQHFKATPD